MCSYWCEFLFGGYSVSLDWFFLFFSLKQTAVVLLLTVPVLYEKYEDEIDSSADKAAAEIKKQYAVFDAKVLRKVMSKVSRGVSICEIDTLVNYIFCKFYWN